MNKTLCIMHEDTHVCTIDFNTGETEIHTSNFLPYPLRGRISNVALPHTYDAENESLRYENRLAIISWLANRTLSLSRKNAKWIYALLNLEQLSDDKSRAKVALLCRAVSILDNFWVKLSSDSTAWSEVNIRHVPLNEVVAQVSLHGKSLTLQGSLATPELTTNGAYAKAWRRYPDGTLWLHKRGATDDYESRVEVCVSNILDKTNVLHCHYEMTIDNDVSVCACPAMTSDTLSILSGFDFYSYCNRFGFNMNQKLIALDKEQYFKQMIVDYLIANRDRHGQNWGVYYDPMDMHFISMHPLFDHNNAFSDEWMDDPDAIYQFNGKSTRESAHYAVKRCNFKFATTPELADFPNQKAYDIFMTRAHELNLL